MVYYETGTAAARADTSEAETRGNRRAWRAWWIEIMFFNLSEKPFNPDVGVDAWEADVAGWVDGMLVREPRRSLSEFQRPLITAAP